MEFKFFTAAKARLLEGDSKFEHEIKDISKKIKEEIKRGSYAVQLPHNKYSHRALRELRNAGFQIDEESPCGILISWKDAVDEENGSTYVTPAYVTKVETDNVVSDILKDIESSIRTCIDQQPGKGSWGRRGRLSRAIREIVEDNGFKVTHYDSTVNRDEFDLIEWQVD